MIRFYSLQHLPYLFNKAIIETIDFCLSIAG